MKRGKKKYYMPAILSALVVGLGQIVKGDSNKGLKWIISLYLLFPAMLYGLFLISARLFVVALAVAIIVYPAFWIYNVADALLRKV